MSDIEPGEQFEYSIDPATEKEFRRSIRGDGWTLTYSGGLDYADGTGTKPRVGSIEAASGLRPMAVSYSVDRMTVEWKRSLDVKGLLPSHEWRLLAVSPASTRNMSPEILRFFQHFQELDVNEKKIYVGKIQEGFGLPHQRWINILLWNVLTARAVAEMGVPGNNQAVETQRKAIEKRREEVLMALQGESDTNPDEIARAPFA